ncbi:hypothetical protein NIES4103_01020 [Nostoc sp. NIES-4103]|nr:hypothetical protein NIES4103_01020 [Nostoc sp. NIES-4103]
MTTVTKTAIANLSDQLQQYDVVIMGAGFAGVCQARHLLLNIPNISVALIDPRPEQRTEEDLKIGESTVEIANLFICKELGLYEYVIENHPPKYGLNYHWPKEVEKTETLNNYYHIWANRQPPLGSTQMNRAKFERDLLQMNKENGVVFYNGRVVDVELTPGDELKTVKVKVGSDYINIKAKHIIDAAGRKFIIGRKKDNLVSEPENLFGINTGSAWVRVKNVDRTIFHNGYDPNGSACSHYYATNHWFGSGHWLWMIPTDTQSKELSVGIIQHRDVIPDAHINTQEKFYAFLKANHNILYKLVTSGELVDFHYLPRLAHTSKTMFSEDNWYVIGDAACIFDAFYSTGTSMTTLEIESVTEIIRAKLANEVDAEKKRVAYNKFCLAYTRSINSLILDHSKQLGHASVMSWRIYFDYISFFGIILPLYVGKWHLDPQFISAFADGLTKAVNGFNRHVYNLFNKLVQQKANIGLMDCYRADQLPWGYHTFKHFDDFLENAKYEPKRCNIFASMKNTYFFQAVWFVTFLRKAFGLHSLLVPQNLYYFFHLLILSGKSALNDLIYQYHAKNTPKNTQVTQMRQEFVQNYEYQPQLQPWIEEASKKSRVLV